MTAAQPSGRRHKKPSGQQTFASDRESDAVSPAAAAFSVFKMSRRRSLLHSEGSEKIAFIVKATEQVVGSESLTTNGENSKIILSNIEQFDHNHAKYAH